MAERNADSRALALAVSKETKDSCGTYIRGHSCYSLAKNLPSLLHAKHVIDAKLK